MKKLVLFALVTFALTFCIRWLAISLATDAFQTDPDSYRMLATEWKATGVFGANSRPTAFRPPLYPWVLSFGADVSGVLSQSFVQSLHALLGALTCCATFYMARGLFISSDSLYSSSTTSATRQCGAGVVSEKSAFLQRNQPEILASLVALSVAVDPILIRQSQLIMTETLATFLAAITLWIMGWACNSPKPSRMVIVGLAIGLSALCRPTALIWGGVFACVLLVATFREGGIKSLRFGWGRRALDTIALGVGLGIFLVPWGIRNYLELDRWIITTTHGGYTLLLANNSSLYEHFEKTASRNWDDEAFQADWGMRIQGLSELEQDRLANSMAKETILSRPGLFLKSCIIRSGWLWALWPNQSSMIVNILIGAWYSCIFLGAFLGGMILWTKDKDGLFGPFILPALCLILSLSLVHAIYWSNLRMRSVAMPAIYVLAIVPIAKALRVIEIRRCDGHKRD